MVRPRFGGTYPLQTYVLIYVYDNKDSPARPGDIARLLMLRQPTVSELLVAMKRKEWITSQEHEHDRRGRVLSLTNNGRAALKRALVALDALAARYNGIHTGSAEAIRVLSETVKQ